MIFLFFLLQHTFCCAKCEEKKFDFIEIQDLKDAHLTEHKRLMDLLDAEREQILIEKAKLETMERLKPTSMPAAKRQTELDAAILIAQVKFKR